MSRSPRARCSTCSSSSGAADVATVARLAAALLLALATANALGPMVAAAVRSLAEAALASAAVSLLLLHFAGFFRVPAEGWTAAVARWMPYRPLREALAAAQGPVAGPADPWWPAVAAGLGILVLLAVSSRIWTRGFEWPRNA